MLFRASFNAIGFFTFRRVTGKLFYAPNNHVFSLPSALSRLRSGRH